MPEFFHRHYFFLGYKVIVKDNGANFYIAKYIEKEIDYDIFVL